VSAHKPYALESYDAVVVGAGPNGLAAAITLVRNGLSTLLVEAEATPGGGMRSCELTLPGYTHDLCSAVHPLGIGSPFFASLPLARHGLTWIDSPAPLAHVFADGSATLLERSIDATAAQFDRDGPAYRRLLEPFVEQFDELLPMILGPLRFPRHPFLMARFGLSAVQSMRFLAKSHFRGAQPSALLAGIAAHAMVPLDSLVTSSFALTLAMAGHAVGWPIARGGSQAIADALVAHYRELGGELALGLRVQKLDDLPSARAYLFDVSPQQLLSIAGDQLPAMYQRRVKRFRYGPGVFKVDWAMSGPIPWRDPRCRRAVTVHLSGDLDQVSASEDAVNKGKFSERPFVLLGQPSLVDETRAPPGMHTVWAYCHVPHGSDVDALPAIEAQLEQFAPGFRDLVVARFTRNAVELAQHSPNYVGGDISGGVSDLTQLFFRPVLRVDPYATPNDKLFLCSASTPPGGGVHGMCGYWAARSALRKVFGKHEPDLARAPVTPR
jgi:phytoene dehydrogenase-like protein